MVELRHFIDSMQKKKNVLFMNWKTQNRENEH